MKKQLEQFIQDGRTEQALLFLQNNVSEGDFKKELVIITARFERLQQQIRQQDINGETASIELNRINDALLSFGDKIDKPIVRAKKPLFVAVAVIVFFLALLWAYQKWSDTFTLTVYVIGEKGVHDKPLKGHGQVTLHEDYDRTENVNAKGEAIFNGIPVSFRTKPMLLNLVKELNVTYEAFKPDSAYIVGDSKSLNLVVRLSGLGQVRGIVRSADNRPLSQVKVSMSQTGSTFTDEDGRFTLNIPKGEQKEELTLTAFKEGFDLLDFNVYPQTGAEAKVILKKK